MPVVPAADTVVHEMHGNRFTSYAAPSLGSTELCVWRLDVPAGTTPLPHRVTREEVLVVVGGRLQVTLDGHATDVGAGDAVVVPAGAEFGAGNAGPGTATAWVSTTAGLEAELPDGTRLTPPWTR